MSSPEQMRGGGAEQLKNTQEAAGEAAEKLKNKFEKGGEHIDDSAERADSARRETEAAFSKEAGKEKRSGGEPSGPPAHATKKQRKAAYTRTMTSIRADMTPAQRTFSRVIHNPVVERTSDIVGNTVARPNAIFAAGLSASILTIIVFTIAKYYGYPLSGFESIGAFILGWAIGLMYDYFRVLVTGRPG